MEPRKRSGTRRNTQREFSLRTHTSQPQRFFFPAIHPKAPPLRLRSLRCEQLKPHTVRRPVKTSAISWVPEAMAAVAAVKLWSTTAVAWVCSPVCQCDLNGYSFHLSQFCGGSFAPEFCSFASSCQLRGGSFLTHKRHHSSNVLSWQNCGFLQALVAQAQAYSRGFKLALTASSQQVPISHMFLALKCVSKNCPCGETQTCPACEFWIGPRWKSGPEVHMRSTRPRWDPGALVTIHKQAPV